MPDIDKNKIYGSLAGALIGDALGWPQERIKKRIDYNSKDESKIPFKIWERISGSRFNSYEQTIGAGEYSDDSQLILITARSLLKGNDWSKYFAGYELPLWLIYERGAGKTLSEAANGWKKSLAPWNEKSKFTKAYFDSGANGAAMRVLPHSLLPDVSLEDILGQVTLNSIITHGHPRAILGALLYASAVRYLITKQDELEYGELIDYLLDSKEIWSKLRPWQKTYEQWYQAAKQVTNNTYLEIWEKTKTEIFDGLMLAKKNLEDGAVASTKNLLSKLGAFNYESKGSGVVSSLSAIYVFSFYVNDPVTGLVELAYSNDADTDTLASMAGGLFGAFLGTEWIHPEWEEFQDKNYIQNLSQQLYKYKIDYNKIDKSLLRWGETDSKKVIEQLLDLNINDAITIGPFQSTSLVEKRELKSIVKKWKHIQWKLFTEIGQTIYITKQSKTEEQIFLRNDIQSLEAYLSAAQDEIVETDITKNAELLIRKVQFYTPYDIEVAFNKENIFVKMADKNFIHRIEKGKVSFTKGDFIIADLKVTLYKSGKKLYEVMKVITCESGRNEPKFNFSE